VSQPVSKILLRSPACPVCETEPPWQQWGEDWVTCRKCHELYLNLRPTRISPGYTPIRVRSEEEEEE
jgi:Zn ribbon nucleic-acid-binding protein